MPRCTARIFHGPGHQSSTQCEYEADHVDFHYCIYGEREQEALWFGGFPNEVPEVFTGFADEPPLFPDFLTGSESLAGVTLEEKWYALHKDWVPCVRGATPTEVVTDEAAEFFANMSEETARAVLSTVPPRMLADIYIGWKNTSTAPDWFAQVAYDVINDIVQQATLNHGTIVADHIDKLWAVVDDRIVTLTVERNTARRKLQDLRDIIEEKT